MTWATIAEDLFTMGEPVAEKALRTVAVYLGILVLLRLAGKRDLAQLNSFDFVVLLLLSNVVQNAVIGNDNSLAGGLFGAAILVAGNAVLVRVFRQRTWMVHLFEGTPTVLVSDGQIDHETIARLGLRKADVFTALRKQGASTVEEVKEATLQPGGTITVVLKEEAENATKGDIERLEAKLDTLLARL
jgi:uncharacterized membrane protein YcaP (DUF421 family)